MSIEIIQREELLFENPIDICPNAKALDVLVAIYRNPRMPLHTRMRAAALAIPFESPKLAVTAVVTSEDIATRLERAKQRSDSVRLIPAAKEIELEPVKPTPTTRLAPDRRFIRRA